MSGGKHPNPKDRSASIKWAQDVLADPRALIFDVETTGLRQAEIVQIGLVDMTGTVLMNTLVKPTRSIPAKASSVHGITDDDVADAPTFPQVYAAFSGHVAAATVIAYNVEYEKSVLSYVCGLHHLPLPRISRWTCAMKTYARFYGQQYGGKPGYTWQSLVKAAAQQGIPVQDAHDAVGDSQMTLALIRAMAGA